MGRAWGHTVIESSEYDAEHLGWGITITIILQSNGLW